MADMHFVYGHCNGNASPATCEYARRFPNTNHSTQFLKDLVDNYGKMEVLMQAMCVVFADQSKLMIEFYRIDKDPT